MANVTYTTQVITAQTRRAAYQRLASLCEHIPYLKEEGTGGNINLVSIVRNADNSISITLTGPISAEQREHLGLP